MDQISGWYMRQTTILAIRVKGDSANTFVCKNKAWFFFFGGGSNFFFMYVWSCAYCGIFDVTTMILWKLQLLRAPLADLVGHKLGPKGIKLS